MLQLRLNIGIWQSVIDYAENRRGADVRGSLLHGIEQFLSEPIMVAPIQLNDFVALWQEAKIIDGLSNTSLLTTDEWRKKHHPILKNNCNAATKKAFEIIACIEKALEKLKPL